MTDGKMRAALERAGFKPDTNWCTCGHRGGDHNLNNACLECDCDRFGSFEADALWEFLLNRLKRLTKRL